MTPNPNEVLSQFREGKDTVDIARDLGIEEAEADAMLQQARKGEDTATRFVLHRGTILAAVTEISHTKLDELLSTRKFSQLVVARRLAIELFREFRPDMTRSAIGRVLKRDHATILHSETSSPVDAKMMHLARARLLALSPQENPGAFVSIYVDTESRERLSA